VKDPGEAAPMVKWARKYGMTSMMHCGGTSIPGSDTVTADQVRATDPDIVSHINGGPTAISLEEAEKLIKETPYAFDQATNLSSIHNPHSARYTLLQYLHA